MSETIVNKHISNLIQNEMLYFRSRICNALKAKNGNPARLKNIKIKCYFFLTDQPVRLTNVCFYICK